MGNMPIEVQITNQNDPNKLTTPAPSIAPSLSASPKLPKKEKLMSRKKTRNHKLSTTNSSTNTVTNNGYFSKYIKKHINHINNIHLKFLSPKNIFSIATTPTIAEQPNLSTQYCNIANTQLKSNQYEKALESYTQAISYNYKNPLAWLGLGNVLYQQKQYKEAIIGYNNMEQLLAKSPQHPLLWRMWFGAGKCFYNLDRYQQAKVCLNKAAALNIKHPPIWHAMGSTLCKLHQYPTGITCYNRAIQLLPLNQNNQSLINTIKDNKNKALVEYKLHQLIQEPYESPQMTAPTQQQQQQHRRRSWLSQNNASKNEPKNTQKNKLNSPDNANKLQESQENLLAKDKLAPFTSTRIKKIQFHFQSRHKQRHQKNATNNSAKKNITNIEQCSNLLKFALLNCTRLNDLNGKPKITQESGSKKLMSQ